MIKAFCWSVRIPYRVAIPSQVCYIIVDMFPQAGKTSGHVPTDRQTQWTCFHKRAFSLDMFPQTGKNRGHVPDSGQVV